MKLLLTSTGITNKTIKKKFIEMVGKKPEDMIVAYIPTAINVTSVIDKRWAIDNLKRLDEMQVGQIDIVDFMAVPKKNWYPRLKQADAIYVEGGNPVYLKLQFEKNGIDKILRKDLSDKVYVGCSAGSTILGKVNIKSSKDKPGYKVERGFKFYDFAIRPHFYRADRAQFTKKLVAKIAKDLDTDFYAIDDNTAVAIVDGKVEVISEGKWKKFNK